MGQDVLKTAVCLSPWNSVINSYCYLPDCLEHNHIFFSGGQLGTRAEGIRINMTAGFLENKFLGLLHAVLKL
jgi:hypothetical protein